MPLPTLKPRFVGFIRRNPRIVTGRSTTWPADYPIIAEECSADLKTAYVVSLGKTPDTQGQILARWDVAARMETARIDLSPETLQTSTFAALCRHPSKSRPSSVERRTVVNMSTHRRPGSNSGSFRTR